MDLLKRQEMLEDAKKRITASSKGSLTEQYKSGKLSARERMNLIFDQGTFVELGAYVKARTNEFMTAKTDDYEGVICGYGAIDGRLVFAYSQDITRLNGAFGKAASDKICSLYDMAIKNAAPVVSVFDSTGAKLTEGLDVLDGYGKIMRKISKIKGKVPQISFICGNASGASAIIASMTDVVIMSEKTATFSLSPVSVLKSCGADENVGTASFASEKGIVSFVCADEQACFAKGREVLSYLPSNRLDKNVYTENLDDENRKTPEIAGIVANEGYDMHLVIAALADGGKYLEINEKNGIGMICAFTQLNGIPCGIVANTGKELCFGSMKKAENFINLCNSFQTSIVTLVDATGFSSECESKGGKISLAAADLAKAYASATVPLVTLNVGNAYGTVFTIMGSKSIGADINFSLDTARIAVMNPVSGVQFMWNDKLAQGKNKKDLEEEWKLKMSSPLEAANYGYIDDIITADEARQRILSAVEMLSMKNDFVTLF